MKRKVLHVIAEQECEEIRGPFIGLLKGLQDQGLEIRVCVLEKSGRSPVDSLRHQLERRGIACHAVHHQGLYDLATCWRLRKVIRDERPDAVHGWEGAGNRYGRAVAWSCGIPCAIASYSHPQDPQSEFDWALDRRLARRTACSVAASSEVQQALLRSGGTASRVVVVPMAIDLNAEATAEKTDLRDELHLPADARLMGTSGPIDARARLRDAVWAADLLKAFRDDTHLVIEGDGPHRWRAERFCDQLELRDRVHFLGRRADLAGWLPQLTCMWICAASGGPSPAALQAMAAGVPLIATDIAAHAPLVQPDETGYRIPVGDRAGLARWSNYLIENPAVALRLGENARRLVQERFAAPRMVQQYLELYRQEWGRSKD